MAKPNTIVISNFGGRLTRLLNGDLNSGFAKFDQSFGYDPFTKPMNLTWLEQPQSIAGVTTTIVAGINQMRPVNTLNPTSNTFVVGPYTVWKLAVGDATTDSIVGIQSALGSGDAYDWGASMALFGQKGNLLIANEGVIFRAGSVVGLNNINLTGVNSILTDSAYMATEVHPMRNFADKLIFGNGPSIGALDGNLNVISSIFTINELFINGGTPQYSELHPAPPANQFIWDMDVSQDNNYLLMSASTVYPERILFFPVDRTYVAPGEGQIYGWNGEDNFVTAATTIPSGTTTASETFLQQKVFFMNDEYGSAVSDGTNKIVSLPNNKSPLPNATSPNGGFVTWMCPEVTPGNTKRVASLYYYGSLDSENPTGLYRMCRYESPLANGFVYQVPYHDVVSNGYKTVNNSASSIVQTSVGKHYFSLFNVSPAVKNASTLGAGGLFRFNVTSTSGNQIQAGVYETQTQIFPKRIHVEQIRVYTESTVSGNGFQIDIIGQDGTPVTNGTFTYTFVAGSDITKLEGSLQRINFNPNADAGYGFGIRVTNTGTVNMVIKKIECDVGEEGR